MMRLHGFCRSSASYRVRIALNLKGLAYDQVAYVLQQEQQHGADYLALNPQGLVPALETDNGVLTQSLAIIEYLDEQVPGPALIPQAPLERARVRAIAQAIACDIHPLNNLRVLKYLTQVLEISDLQKSEWYHHWINLEFGALEQRLASDAHTGRFCHGDSPTLADICLVPQCFNAKRFKVDMNPYPTIERIVAACQSLEAFARAAPDAQPDASA